MNKRYWFYTILVLGILLVIVYKDDIKQSYYMELGDSASKCAAIYSIAEPSFLGQAFEFFIFVNPIDDSENYLAEKIIEQLNK